MTSLLFRTRDISNDYTTNIHGSTTAVGHLFEAKRFRVVERAGAPSIGYRIGHCFNTMAELPRTIDLMIDYAHELGKRTTVYNINITRAVFESGEQKLYISCQVA